MPPLAHCLATTELSPPLPCMAPSLAPPAPARCTPQHRTPLCSPAHPSRSGAAPRASARQPQPHSQPAEAMTTFNIRCRLLPWMCAKNGSTGGLSIPGAISAFFRGAGVRYRPPGPLLGAHVCVGARLVLFLRLFWCVCGGTCGRPGLERAGSGARAGVHARRVPRSPLGGTAGAREGERVCRPPHWTPKHLVLTVPPSSFPLPCPPQSTQTKDGPHTWLPPRHALHV